MDGEPGVPATGAPPLEGGPGEVGAGAGAAAEGAAAGLDVNVEGGVAAVAADAAAVRAARSRGFSSLIQPVSTAVMNTKALARSAADVRVIMFSAALAMFVCGCVGLRFFPGARHGETSTPASTSPR